MERPDYAGGGLANLVASVVRGLGPPGAPVSVPQCALMGPERLREARHVVLLLIDGLGRAQLERHAPRGALAAARVGDLTSVFPSTTASAITTLMSAEVPASHGLTGWHVWLRELGVIGAPLPFRVRGADVSLAAFGLEANALLASRSLFDRLARRGRLVHPRHLADSAYTRAHAGGAEVRAFDRLTGMFDRVAEVAREREPSYTYAYWPELDSLSHVHGASSARAGAHLQALDTAFERCVERLRGTGTVLLVTADHGFVDTRGETRIALESHPELADTLALPLCGEPRAVYCYLRPGAEADFRAYLSEQLASQCEVHRSVDLLERGYLGPGPRHPTITDRLGTYTLLMRGAYCLVDRLPGERPFAQVGVHGGMSDAELRVPLCVAAD